MIALHIVPQFFLEQQTGHLYALRAVKARVRLILIFLILQFLRLLISLLVLRDEETRIHFFFSELKTILKGLRSWRSVIWMATVAPICILLQLMLVLVLL